MTINEILSKTNLPEIVAQLDKRDGSLNSLIPDERKYREIQNKPDEDKK